jgi:hypothetical protein
VINKHNNHLGVKMFIYRITVLPLNQCYIGLDTGPEYKESRWRAHCKESINNPKGKLHKAINQFGPENCVYEVIERGFTSKAQLALAEIKQIKNHNSYRNGLNSTLGGDGLNTDLTLLTDEEEKIIRESLGEKWRDFNQKRWSGTSPEERKEMVKHCHTDEAKSSRSKTLKRYYDSIPNARDKHSAGIKQWQKENPELAKQYRIQNGLKGAAKTSKKVTVMREDGSIEVYNSISEFQRVTKQWMCTIKEKSASGLFFNGYKLIKDMNDKPI